MGARGTETTDMEPCTNHVCTLYCEFAGCDHSNNAHLFGHGSHDHGHDHGSHHHGHNHGSHDHGHQTPPEDDQILTNIFDAIDARHATAVGKILQLDHDAACQFNGTGRSALHEACAKGADEICLLLLKHRADPVAKDLCGLTPLHIASYVGSYPVAQVGSKVHVPDNDDLFDRCLSRLRQMSMHGT